MRRMWGLPWIAVLAAAAGCGGDEGSLDALGPVAVEPVFEEVALNGITDVQSHGEGSAERLYVAQKGGVITRFDPADPAGSAETFLDISGVDGFGSAGEGGLVGLAFHPDFASNGYFFVHYTRQKNLGSASEVNEIVIARFTADGSPPVDPASEKVVLEVPHPGHINHYAGALAFGPLDGYLYLTMGDGGGSFDPGDNGQDLGTLLGAILRIDVSTLDATGSYAIPSGNPFAGNDQGFREEIFAYGFRNPFRLSIDQPEPGRQRVWVADVGQNEREEVDLLRASGGGNYGWDCREGSRTVDPQRSADACDEPSVGPLRDPVTEYGHELGRSITGGHVYRGSRLPALVGRYVFGDFGSGRIWVYDPESDARGEIANTELAITSFARRADGELLVAEFGGGLYRLSPQ